MKKILKILGLILLVGIVAMGILYAVYNESIPEGKSGPEADALAEKMLKAINYETYKNTRFLEWSFVGGAHKYKWDKTNGTVEVSWDDYKVDLNLGNTEDSFVSKGGTIISAKESQKTINEARDFFNNDSFWLVAPFKVFDKGTTRSIVTLDDGTEALLINYASGGSTPGDSYLWKLLPNGFPESYKMWAQVVPIGGAEASWDDWKIMENGLALPATHKMGPVTMDMGDVKAYND
jgi:hypothetical protein